MYNKIVLVGNLTRDIEIKYTQSASAIGNTAIATSHKFKAQDGTQKEEILFVDITFFGRTAEIANQYLRKGSKVLVDGRLKLDQWKAQDGTGRSKHSVIVESLQMIGSKDDNSQEQPQQQGYETSYEGYSAPLPQNNAPTPQHAPLPEIDIDTDEIPF